MNFGHSEYTHQPSESSAAFKKIDEGSILVVEHADAQRGPGLPSTASTEAILPATHRSRRGPLDGDDEGEVSLSSVPGRPILPFFLGMWRSIGKLSYDIESGLWTPRLLPLFMPPTYPHT